MVKVLELFAGIGACSKALTNLGIQHEIVDAVEIDKYAIKSFNAVHGTDFEPQDITTWDKDIKCDLIMHGSPCQNFSVAGKNAGGDQGSGTRSSLMYETLRIVEKLKPKYVIWENVKNLLSAKHRHNFDAYLERMTELGYVNYYQVLNAKDYGVPQNRERVFTVSIRLDVPYCWAFEFPEPVPLEKKLKDVLEKEVDEKYYLSDDKAKTLKFSDVSKTIRSSGRGLFDRHSWDIVKVGDLDIRGQDQIKRVYDPGGVSPTLSTMQGVIDGYRIRKLTPLECWRLMGFDDADFHKAEKVNSNTQLYKQAGNSICVNVLEAILTNLLIRRQDGTKAI